MQASTTPTDMMNGNAMCNIISRVLMHGLGDSQSPRRDHQCSLSLSSETSAKRVVDHPTFFFFWFSRASDSDFGGVFFLLSSGSELSSSGFLVLALQLEGS